jgi:hypothetical protein
MGLPTWVQFLVPTTFRKSIRNDHLYSPKSQGSWYGNVDSISWGWVPKLAEGWLAPCEIPRETCWVVWDAASASECPSKVWLTELLLIVVRSQLPRAMWQQRTQGISNVNSSWCCNLGQTTLPGLICDSAAPTPHSLPWRELGQAWQCSVLPTSRDY